jgi:hypothetical protein
MLRGRDCREQVSPKREAAPFTDRGKVDRRRHMMTSAEHDARCEKVLYVDLKFGTDCRWLGVYRDRLYCVDGHSVYVDVTPTPAVEREATPRPSGLCTRCNEPFAATLDQARSYCPPCLKIVELKHARRMFVRKPGESKAKNSGVCPACSTPLERDRRYCDALCRQTHLANRRASRKARQPEAMAGVI